jgi:uncharacterized protein YyaL (SSP411 family)
MPNRLAAEKSPYLRQHAGNPVDWLPWGEEAFARARAEQKPLFVSIGYSTCHWCHVMAHESFEDPDTGDLLNAHFIPVKIDREERPDVDRVYMAYVQAMTGHGGWPLSVWLTPELKPFFGGTYFPPEDRQGRAGFPSILRAIARGWETERDKLVAEGERAIRLLRESHEGPVPAAAGPLVESAGEAFERGFEYFNESFDPQHGGFGGAPKFPRASVLNFLLRVAALQGPAEGAGATALQMASVTLRMMAMGGIHDQVGGGYHRYSVDGEWFVPHFEKMLYDQAQIALNCLEVRVATGDERYAWMARDIFDYVLRDLAAPGGGFYSAEDADGEPPGGGHPAEGAFYLWTHGELASLLGADLALFETHFGLAPGGNVPPASDPHAEFRGGNILAQRQPLLATARALQLDPEEANRRLHAGLAALRAVRERRPRPQRDEKIITAWNGLMISALARGHAVLGPEEGGRLLAAATRAAEFIARELYDAGRGVLYRSWLDGRGAAEAFAEDYACLIQGLLDLYEAGFELRWLQWARRLQEKMDELFRGPDGSYFNSAAGAPDLVLRLREDYDGAEPAPGSIAALNQLRIAAIYHDADLRTRGGQTIAAFESRWRTAPQALPQMLVAVEAALEAPRHVVLAGDPAAADFQALHAEAVAVFGPRRTLLRADPAVPWTAPMAPREGRATAYVCEDYACRSPVVSPAELRPLLRPAG